MMIKTYFFLCSLQFSVKWLAQCFFLLLKILPKLIPTSIMAATCYLISFIFSYLCIRQTSNCCCLCNLEWTRYIHDCNIWILFFLNKILIGRLFWDYFLLLAGVVLVNSFSSKVI